VRAWLSEYHTLAIGIEGNLDGGLVLVGAELELTLVEAMLAQDRGTMYALIVRGKVL